MNIIRDLRCGAGDAPNTYFVKVAIEIIIFITVMKFSKVEFIW